MESLEWDTKVCLLATTWCHFFGESVCKSNLLVVLYYALQ